MTNLTHSEIAPTFRDDAAIAQPARLLRSLLLAGLAVALSGSLWAVLGGDGCASCSRSAELVGNLDLGLAGMLYYGLLLLTALWWSSRHPIPAAPTAPFWLRGGVLLAGGIHVTLLALLLRYRVVCLPCLLTAAGALTGTAAALWMDRAHLLRAVALLTAVAVVAYFGTRILRKSAAGDSMAQARKAERLLLAERPLPTEGHARMVVYVRAGCHFCEQFETEVLAPLRKEFPGELEVERRRAWKGMMTPTSVILGRRHTLLVGYKPLATVRQAVHLARGATL